jgi:hypothetical protein
MPSNILTEPSVIERKHRGSKPFLKIWSVFWQKALMKAWAAKPETGHPVSGGMHSVDPALATGVVHGAVGQTQVDEVVEVSWTILELTTPQMLDATPRMELLIALTSVAVAGVDGADCGEEGNVASPERPATIAPNGSKALEESTLTGVVLGTVGLGGDVTGADGLGSADGGLAGELLSDCSAKALPEMNHWEKADCSGESEVKEHASDVYKVVRLADAVTEHPVNIVVTHTVEVHEVAVLSEADETEHIAVQEDIVLVWAEQEDVDDVESVLLWSWEVGLWLSCWLVLLLLLSSLVALSSLFVSLWSPPFSSAPFGGQSPNIFRKKGQEILGIFKGPMGRPSPRFNIIAPPPPMMMGRNVEDIWPSLPVNPRLLVIVVGVVNVA